MPRGFTSRKQWRWAFWQAQHRRRAFPMREALKMAHESRPFRKLPAEVGHTGRQRVHVLKHCRARGLAEIARKR